MKIPIDGTLSCAVDSILSIIRHQWRSAVSYYVLLGNNWSTKKSIFAGFLNLFIVQKLRAFLVVNNDDLAISVPIMGELDRKLRHRLILRLRFSYSFQYTFLV
jgi:hypothetical protein